jgi:hypothetical protein
MKQIIYIAGQVTGLKREQALANFQNAEGALHAKGYETVNPMRRIPSGSSWEEAMEICLQELTNVDGIFLQPNWTKSKGAIREVFHYIAICDSMGRKPIILSYEDLKPETLNPKQ